MLQRVVNLTRRMRSWQLGVWYPRQVGFPIQFWRTKLALTLTHNLSRSPRWSTERSKHHSCQSISQQTRLQSTKSQSKLTWACKSVVMLHPRSSHTQTFSLTRAKSRKWKKRMNPLESRCVKCASTLVTTAAVRIYLQATLTMRARKPLLVTCRWASAFLTSLSTNTTMLMHTRARTPIVSSSFVR